MVKARTDLTETLKKLRTIAQWFESQEEVDVEKGIEKIKEGAELIRAGRTRLKELENEFEELKKKLDEEA
jgi:exonuclease VII small subunit